MSLDHVVAAGDGTVSYSPHTSLQGSSPVNKCTALATITGEHLHQEVVRDDFRPWPLAAHLEQCRASGAQMQVSRLSFCRNPVHWASAFRRGLRT